MHTPVIALTWELWRRHRLGLAGVWVMVLGFSAVCSLDLYESRSGAAVHSTWFVMGLAYVIGVFAYGFDGRLEAAESGFPARLLLLPVRTWLLVGWPMLQGMSVAVLMWVLWDYLVLRPSGLVLPAWWTPMLAAVVATSQAVVWRSFPLPWLRLAVAVPAVLMLLRIEPLLRLLGVTFADADAKNTTLSLVAVAVTAAAYLAAWSGVSSVRHGSEVGWLRSLFQFAGSRRSWRERGAFASPLSAQVWYEWRRRGLGYLLTATICNGIIMLGAMLFEPRSAAADYASIFLILPIMIAGFWGLYMGAGDSVKSVHELTAFTTTRPLSNAGMVAAKVKMAAISAAVCWAVVVAVTSIWVALTDFTLVSRLWNHSIESLGLNRTVVLSVVVFVCPVLLIWRCLVINLWVGLVGRAWVSGLFMFFSMWTSSSIFLVCWLWLKTEPARMDRFLDVLPWLAGEAVFMKMVVAGWLMRTLIRRGELSLTDAAKAVGIWLGIAASLIAVLGWVTYGSVSGITFLGAAFGVVLALPLARLALAPLALAWNRHR